MWVLDTGFMVFGVPCPLSNQPGAVHVGLGVGTRGTSHTPGYARTVSFFCEP